MLSIFYLLENSPIRDIAGKSIAVNTLDAMTKMGMQQELTRIWRGEHVTTILVSHDLEEAIYLATASSSCRAKKALRRD